MDIKLKKSKASIFWICFFVGVSLVISTISAGILVLNADYHGTINLFENVFKDNLRDTTEFKHTVSLKFNLIAQALINKNSDLDDVKVNLDVEGQNLIYYAVNHSTGVKISNYENYPDLPKEYGYHLYFDGSEITVEDSGIKTNVYANDSGYMMLKYWGYLSSDINETRPDLADCMILLAVKDDIVKVPDFESSFYRINRQMSIYKWVIFAYIAILVFGIALIVLSVLKWHRKVIIDKKLGCLTGRIWIELKAGAAVIYLLFLSGLYHGRSDFFSASDIPELLSGILIMIITFWIIYIAVIDLWYNRRRVFKHNIINSAIKSYRIYENRKSFQKGLLLRIYVFMVVEILLVIIAGISAITFAFRENMLSFIIFMICFLAGAYIAFKYVRRYRETVIDIGILADQIEAIKDGVDDFKSTLNPDADLYKAAQSLNKIREGINKVVEERIKSERTKVELITNVSHDLKTPLTSIVSYVDLLSKEEDLPEHVKDYVKILGIKSERLKLLISDLFDLSKAASGDIMVDFEKIDINKLIKQTLADMDDQISCSQLVFKVGMPEEPVLVFSDGKKLYRVFQNLITNALKYSLAGSRVYIDLLVEGDKCKAVIKNIAAYEMDFAGDEVVERFVRGDKARSGEGSGLGLAIARSFTNVCKGRFNIVIDGDMFKVILEFDLAGMS